MMTANHRKVVARYADGRLVKGYTFDFGPSQARFHVFAHPTASGPSSQVLVRELKAVFFVRDLVGNPSRQDSHKFPSGEVARPHVEIRFRDGEVMVGTADSPASDPQGFFLIPADPESNNLRVYVVAAATRVIYPLSAPARPTTSGAIAARSDRSLPGVGGTPLLPGRLFSWLTR
jgi:hypothetical protein